MAATAKYADLQAAFSALTDLATGGGEMLKTGLPHAVEPSADERHAYQTELVTMVLDELRQAREAIEKKQASTNERFAEEQAHIKAAKARVEEITTKEEAAKNDVNGKSEALAAARMAVKGAERNHAESELVKTRMDRKLAELQKVRDRVAFAKESHLSMLCSGGWEDSDAQKEAVETVVQLIKEIGAEDTLVVAMPAVFKVKPEARQPFDKFVEQAVVELVARHLEKLEAEIAVDTELAEQLSAEALGLWAIADVARDAVGVAEEALASSKGVLVEITDQRIHSETILTQHDKEVSELLTSQVLDEQRVSKFAAAIEAATRLQVDDYKDRGEPAQEGTAMDVDASASCAAEAKTGAVASDVHMAAVA
mmetsp:Transcript_42754/g.118045  ORF Transcript_42754/g.118045 Transcript_42754/m.118045 type:complete len:368 (+) Transcript_42754:98-1201(+)